MEGQVEDNLERNNVEIYRKIQIVNLENRQTEMKKISLKDKKRKLLKQIEFMRKQLYQTHKNGQPFS